MVKILIARSEITHLTGLLSQQAYAEIPYAKSTISAMKGEILKAETIITNAQAAELFLADVVEKVALENHIDLREVIQGWVSMELVLNPSEASYRDYQRGLRYTQGKLTTFLTLAHMPEHSEPICVRIIDRKP